MAPARIVLAVSTLAAFTALIEDIAARHGLFVISDEIYSNLAYADSGMRKLASVIGKNFFAELGDTAGVLAALGLFGAGFFFRPLGALIFGVIISGFTFLKLDAYYQEMVKGIIIVAAVVLDQWRQKGRARG